MISNTFLLTINLYYILLNVYLIYRISQRIKENIYIIRIIIIIEEQFTNLI